MSKSEEDQVSFRYTQTEGEEGEGGEGGEGGDRGDPGFRDGDDTTDKHRAVNRIRGLEGYRDTEGTKRGQTKKEDEDDVTKDLLSKQHTGYISKTETEGYVKRADNVEERRREQRGGNVWDAYSAHGITREDIEGAEDAIERYTRQRTIEVIGKERENEEGKRETSRAREERGRAGGETDSVDKLSRGDIQGALTRQAGEQSVAINNKGEENDGSTEGTRETSREQSRRTAGVDTESAHTVSIGDIHSAIERHAGTLSVAIDKEAGADQEGPVQTTTYPNIEQIKTKRNIYAKQRRPPPRVTDKSKCVGLYNCCLMSLTVLIALTPLLCLLASLGIGISAAALQDWVVLDCNGSSVEIGFWRWCNGSECANTRDLQLSWRYTTTLSLLGAGYVANLFLSVIVIGHLCTLGRSGSDEVNKGLAVGCLCSGVMIFFGTMNLSGYVNQFAVISNSTFSSDSCVLTSSTTSLPWLLTYVAASFAFGAALCCTLMALVRHTGRQRDDSSGGGIATKIGWGNMKHHNDRQAGASGAPEGSCAGPSSSKGDRVEIEGKDNLSFHEVG